MTKRLRIAVTGGASRMRTIILMSTVAIAALAGAQALAPPNGSTAASTGVTVSQPFLGRPLYVDPNSSAAWAMARYPATAPYIKVIANTPQARWYGDWIPTAQLTKSVDGYVASAFQAGKLPVLVIYAIPFRDCGGFSAGGLAGVSEYSAWIQAFRAGLGGRPVAVVLEPDALTSADCLPATAKQNRLKLLRDAVTELTADGSTALYIDGGHSRWLSASDLADRLRQVGVQKARGFSLNVSNFYSTSEEIAYGEAVSKLLDGAHYVIDTSRNGRGPAPEAPLNWCNPPGRALGSVPTAFTGAQHADALLWIKHPGESDGDCGRGGPVSGSWFNSYVVDLVKRSSTVRHN